MTVAISWRGLDQEASGKVGSTSRNVGILKAAFRKQRIEVRDVGVLRAIGRAAAGDLFYDEVADVVSQFGAIEFREDSP